jgi:GTP-binding protein LepA
MDNIRNFCIIAHINHGKSTLADRFLEITGTLDKNKLKPQFLDSMGLERERGITVRMHPVRMIYKTENFKLKNQNIKTTSNSEFILNLIDTPGHTDFSYEVSRALKAVEGAILLVEAVKGVQAQTVSHFRLALKENLKIIAAVNKIDLAEANTQRVKQQIHHLTGIPVNEIFEISAKTGSGVKEILDSVIEKFPPPPKILEPVFKALIFDSEYDAYQGVVAHVRVFSGSIKRGDKILLLGSKATSEVKEVGIFTPKLTPTDSLNNGEIGYIATGLKDIHLCRVGDTIVVQDFKFQTSNFKIEPLAGYEEPKPNVFASFYPMAENEFERLKEALEKLRLNDAALNFEYETSGILGRGFRIGALGSLHLEIILERLKRDFNISVITTSPSVAYKVSYRESGKIINKDIMVPAFLPPREKIIEIKEPWVSVSITTPILYLGAIMDLIKNFRNKFLKMENIDESTVNIFYEMPLSDIMEEFYDKLKSVSSGYASFYYEFLEYRPGDLVKLEFLVHYQVIEPFSKIVPAQKAEIIARKMCKKLKEIIPRQQFPVAIQGRVGGKILARENIKAITHDLTSWMYGGDITRKMKKWNKQKETKKEQKKFGKITLTRDTFLKLIKTES